MPQEISQLLLNVHWDSEKLFMLLIKSDVKFVMIHVNTVMLLMLLKVQIVQLVQMQELLQLIMFVLLLVEN